MPVDWQAVANLPDRAQNVIQAASSHKRACITSCRGAIDAARQSVVLAACQHCACCRAPVQLELLTTLLQQRRSTAATREFTTHHDYHYHTYRFPPIRSARRPEGNWPSRYATSIALCIRPAWLAERLNSASSTGNSTEKVERWRLHSKRAPETTPMVVRHMPSAGGNSATVSAQLSDPSSHCGCPVNSASVSACATVPAWRVSRTPAEGRTRLDGICSLMLQQPAQRCGGWAL